MLQLNKKNCAIISLISLVLLIVFTAFLSIFRYAHLSGDDYARIFLNYESFTDNYLDWITTHNGRFANAFVSLIPVYSITTIRSILILNFCSTPIVIYLFLNRLLKLSGYRIHWLKICIAAGILFLLMIIQLPLLVEYFYWYAAMTVYSFSFLSFLLFVYFLMGVVMGKAYSSLGAFFSLIFSIGNNEIFILVINFILLITTLFFIWKKSPKIKQTIYLQISSVFISLLVVLMPGSSHRQSTFEDGGDIISSVILSLKNSISILINQVKTIEDLTVLLVGVWLSLFLSKNNKVSSIVIVNPFVLLMVSYILLFLIILVPNYAMGGISYNQGRIGNIIQILLLFIIFLNILNLIAYFKSIQQTLLRRLRQLIEPILLVSLFSVLLVSKNLNNLYLDFMENAFQTAELDRKERLEFILSSNNEEIKVKRLESSRTLKYQDFTSDPDFWYNKAYTSYINHTYKRDIRSIKIKSTF